MPEYLPDLSFIVDGLPEAGPGRPLPPLPSPRLPEPPASVWLNGREVSVPRCLLDRPDETPAVAVTVTVNLTVEDVVAVLVNHNVNYGEELLSDEFLWETVAGAVLNFGCLKLEDWRCDYPTDLFDGAEEDVLAYVADVRARVAEVFAGVVSCHA